MNILVFGDSIAYGKWDEQGGWVQRLRKYIDKKYNLIDEPKSWLVYNLGIPGDLAVRLPERLTIELSQRFFNEETLVIFAIGINDSCANNWMSGKLTPDDEFKTAIQQSITIAKQYNCKVCGIGLTPINESKSKGRLFNNKDVERFEDMLAEVYSQMDIPFLRLFKELNESQFEQLLVDSVHPNSEGHEILFEKVNEFLHSQNFLVR
ncbi:MAG: GDSL-type esterase/lipase family protein [Microgenomates group bacterium]